MRDSLQVEVDKAAFIEVGRVFKRVYRSNAKNVILKLANGKLILEFHGGGAELPCVHSRDLVAEMSGKAFAGIITAHNHEKSLTGKTTLTFRPKLGEFATALAGGTAKIELLPTRSAEPDAG